LKALETPEVRRVIDAGGFYAVGGAPERFAAFLKQDYDHQNRLMTELGLKAK
jgi:tripartite-type tricarboxylate transporter receptor subunit TctC